MDEARRCPHCASEGAVSRGHGAGSAALPLRAMVNALSGTPLRACTQGTLAVVRGVAGGGDGEGLGGALRRGGEHGIAPLWRTGFWRRRGAIRRYSRGSWKRTTSWRACAPAWTQGTAAGPRRRCRGLSREQVPVLMAADLRAGRRSCGARCGGARRVALDAGGREGRPCWSPGGASYPPHSTARWGNGHVQGEQPPWLKDFLVPAAASSPAISIPELVPPRRIAPGANDRAASPPP